MAHLVNAKREYRLLQQRLDLNVTGAPASPTFHRILQLLFTPEEAAFARKIPSRPISLRALSRKLARPEDELGDQVTAMAQRGVLLDFVHNGKRYVTLPPVVIGFYEFTFMRARDEMPMAELAALFDRYMNESDRFARAVFAGDTQIGRSLVREDALPDEPYVEILDYERASHIVQTATAAAVSRCPCRHKAEHLDKACARPQRTCLTFNYAADSLVRNGIAEPLTQAEAMAVLAECKDAGLAQTADNVQQTVSYICNCCGCCCGMMQAIRTFDIRNAIVSSNWIMEVDPDTCNGCGRCVESCPVGAIALAEERGEWRDATGRRRTRRRWAVRDEELCLGCGTCYGACQYGALRMRSRDQRVYTPETTFDRVVTMAVERGKLAGLLFDDPERLSHRALGRMMTVLQNLPPVQAALAVKPLRSVFLNTLVGAAKQQTGGASGAMADGAND